MDLKQQLVKYKEDKKRLNELEKKCKLLEETIKTKNLILLFGPQHKTPVSSPKK